MVAVSPLHGQVVRRSRVSDVVSPAYDALTVPQRRAYRDEHPLCYLHVTRSAPDEDDAATVDNATLVRRGRAALERLLEADVFDPPTEPALLVYELETATHRQRGVVAEVAGHEFQRTAKPHESTRPERAALLAEHFRFVRAASSPVACTLARGARLDAALAGIDASPPLVAHTGADGLTQRIWRVEDPAMAEEIHASLANDDLFIIDGHHRAAANAQLLAAGVDAAVLVAIFAPEALQLCGFHRLVKLPPSMSETDFLAAVARRFRVETHDELRASEPGSVEIHAGGRWHTVRFDERPAAGGPLVRLGSLDPSVVEREIIGAIVGRDIDEVDVEYMPDEGDDEAVVAHAQLLGRVPILVPPVTVADMVEVADGGLTMPAKSTYFVPKVRSGLFLRRLDDAFAD